MCRLPHGSPPGLVSHPLHPGLRAQLPTTDKASTLRSGACGNSKSSSLLSLSPPHGDPSRLLPPYLTCLLARAPSSPRFCPWCLLSELVGELPGKPHVFLLQHFLSHRMVHNWSLLSSPFRNPPSHGSLALAWILLTVGDSLSFLQAL